MNEQELPLGFGFALAQEPAAMRRFTALPASEQSGIVQRARAVSSKDEMRELVRELSAQG